MLALDIGNTHSRFAEISGSAIEEISRWRTGSSIELKPDRLKGERVLGASVVPDEEKRIRDHLRSIDVETVWVSHETPFDFSIQVKEPDTIGVDRLLNVQAIASRSKKNSIVVDAGTATTIDVLEEGRSFLGGAIAPGLKVMMSGLAHSGSQLYNVPFEVPEKVVGDCTQDAIQSGVVEGFRLMVQGLVGKMIRERGWREFDLIGTGGAIEVLKNLGPFKFEIEPNLLWKGLESVNRRL